MKADGDTDLLWILVDAVQNALKQRLPASVPGLGTFSVVRHPSQYRRDETGDVIIVPPRRELLFRTGEKDQPVQTPKQNSIVPYVAQNLTISLKEADLSIRRFGLTLRAQLSNRNSHSVPGLGTFTTDKQGLKFEPEDTLLEVAGIPNPLGPIVVVPGAQAPPKPPISNPGPVSGDQPNYPSSDATIAPDNKNTTTDAMEPKDISDKNDDSVVSSAPTGATHSPDTSTQEPDADHDEEESTPPAQSDTSPPSSMDIETGSDKAPSDSTDSTDSATTVAEKDTELEPDSSDDPKPSSKDKEAKDADHDTSLPEPPTDFTSTTQKPVRPILQRKTDPETGQPKRHTSRRSFWVGAITGSSVTLVGAIIVMLLFPPGASDQTSEPAPIDTADSSVQEPGGQDNDTPPVESPVVNEPIADDPDPSPTTPEEPSAEQVSIPPSDRPFNRGIGGFTLIVGYSNNLEGALALAGRYLQETEELGMPVEILQSSDGRLFRVGVDQFPTTDDATRIKDALSEIIPSDAWPLRIPQN